MKYVTNNSIGILELIFQANYVIDSLREESIFREKVSYVKCDRSNKIKTEK